MGAKSRLYFVSPKENERFILRILLLLIRGETSYESLRTHNGVVHTAFKEAAITRGLTWTDAEWDQVMTQAALFSMPSALRSLFVTICLLCQPSSLLFLFSDHFDSMSEDFRRAYPEDVTRNMCLTDINEQLMALNSSNAALLMPHWVCQNL